MHKRFNWWLRLFLLPNGHEQDYSILRSVQNGDLFVKFLSKKILFHELLISPTVLDYW